MRRLALAVLGLLCTLPAQADPAARFDAVLQPYAGTFSGTVFVVRDGAILFDKAYGYADAAHGVPNRPSISFHVGTLSMQYTAVAVMHLIRAHHLNLDNTAGQFVPDLGAKSAATIQSLLATPPDAPDAIANYEILAKVAAAASGKSFADVIDAGAFPTMWMKGSGVDDGTMSSQSRMARGTDAAGNTLAPDWTALAGAASAFTTTRDELHWLDSFFADDLLPRADRVAMTSGPAGYGWFHGQRLGSDSYWMAGRTPGFASYVFRQPQTGVTVIVLSNVDGAPVAQIGDGLAAAALGK